MNALTCNQVQDDIELFAAEECDAPTRAAIQRHLAGCPACNAVLDEARQMLGLLTLRLREPAGLARLQQRLGAEARKRERPAIILFVGRVTAFAAVLLLTVGMYFWFSPAGRDNGSGPPTTVALIQRVSPDTVYRVRSANEVELEHGEVYVALPAQEKSAFVVATAAGSARAEATEFFVKVPRDEAAVQVNVVRGKVALSNTKGSTTVRPGETAAAQRDAAPLRQIENLALRFGRSYQPVKVQAAGKVPPYALPVDLAKVKHVKAVAGYLPLQDARPLLAKSGFAVVPDARFTDLISPYEDLRDHDIPVVITADTLLHLYRLHLTASLRDIEEREFAGDLVQLTQALAAKVAEGKDAEGQPARQLALTYLGVALLLQQPKAPLPAGTNAADVAEVVKAIESGATLKPVPGLGYAVDFADFRPVGHYTQGKKLPGYFRAMMWYGRVPLLLRGGADRLVSEEQARRQTVAGGLIAAAVEQARLPDGRSALEVWQRIETVTAFYVGLSDEPGPVQYAAALARAAGKSPGLAELNRPGGMQAFERALVKYTPLPLFANVAHTPAAWRNVDDLVAQLDPAAGFRLFGQRFAPDVYALSKLIYPNVGSAHDGRGLPDGLDLMALLGSKLARQLVKESGEAPAAGPGSLSYAQALEKLQGDFARFDDVDWNANLYWSWLYTLQPLLHEHGAGFPTYMAMPAYNAHLMNTALASWAQLRRDTVLYTKKRDTLLEAMTTKAVKSGELAPGPKRDHVPPAYLEPLPEVYGRLLALTRMSRQQLTSLKVLNAESRQRLEDLEKLLERVVRLAEKELANDVLDQADEQFLRALPHALRHFAAARDVKQIEKLQQTLKELTEAKLAANEARVKTVHQQLFMEEYGPVSAPLVTTVAVDTVTGNKVLQTAIGRVDLAVFIVPWHDGSLMMAVGPVLSYYEWQVARKDEWTEETWLQRLGRDEEPLRPAWTKMFLAAGK
jgi:hypothetical protein